MAIMLLTGEPYVGIIINRMKANEPPSVLPPKIGYICVLLCSFFYFKKCAIIDRETSFNRSTRHLPVSVKIYYHASCLSCTNQAYLPDYKPRIGQKCLRCGNDTMLSTPDGPTLRKKEAAANENKSCDSNNDLYRGPRS